MKYLLKALTAEGLGGKEYYKKIIEAKTRTELNMKVRFFALEFHVPIDKIMISQL